MNLSVLTGKAKDGKGKDGGKAKNKNVKDQERSITAEKARGNQRNKNRDEKCGYCDRVGRVKHAMTNGDGKVWRARRPAIQQFSQSADSAEV